MILRCPYLALVLQKSFHLYQYGKLQQRHSEMKNTCSSVDVGIQDGKIYFSLISSFIL